MSFIVPRVLIISDNAGLAAQVRAALAIPNSGSFEVQWVRQLSAAIEYLGEKETSAFLLDLSLPDSNGTETFERLFAAAPDIPILILSADDQETLAAQAVGLGAHDYLLPKHLDRYSLPRALRNAVERKFVEDALNMERERAIVTLNSIGDAVLCTDVSGKITYLNLVAESMTG